MVQQPGTASALPPHPQQGMQYLPNAMMQPQWFMPQYYTPVRFPVVLVLTRRRTEGRRG